MSELEDRKWHITTHCLLFDLLQYDKLSLSVRSFPSISATASGSSRGSQSAHSLQETHHIPQFTLR